LEGIPWFSGLQVGHPLPLSQSGVPRPAEITATLAALVDTDLYPIVAMALATGMRRGELLSLRWVDVDLDGAAIHVERSLEVTKSHGYRFKSPKTRAGLRTISIPENTVDMLREHRRKVLEFRMAIGAGKLEPDALVFCRIDGRPLPPSHLTYRWRQVVGGRWTFHALRHTHASALIAGGVDIVTISRRLGHSSPAITLRVYAHLFHKVDTAAADAIGKVLGAISVPNGPASS
jgi:integrase